MSSRRAIALSSASFAAFGLCLTLPGALLPVLVDHFDVRLVEAGTVLAGQLAAHLIAVLLADRLLRLLGVTRVLAGALALMAGGIAGFGMAPSWSLAGIGLFISGLGLGLTEVGVNTVIIDVAGDRRTNVLNFAHLFFGVAAFAGPLLATHAVGLGISWRWPYFTSGGLCAIVALGWLLVRVDEPSAAPSESDLHNAKRIDRTLVALLATLLGVYVGVETGVGAWLTKYLTTVQQISIEAAGNVLALYWLGLTVVRLVLTFTAHHVRDEYLVVAFAMVSTAALTATLRADEISMITVGFAVYGMGLSGIFPTVIAIGAHTHPHAVARVTSIIVAGAGLGGIVIPWVMSAIADRTSVTTGMTFYAAMSFVMVALAVALAGRRSRSGE